VLAIFLTSAGDEEAAAPLDGAKNGGTALTHSCGPLRRPVDCYISQLTEL
jgi:hypothetical protein